MKYYNVIYKNTTICILLILFILFHIRRKENLNKYLYDITYTKTNKTIVESERKIFNDIDLQLPQKIEYNILINTNIIFHPKIIIATLSSPYHFKKRISFRYNSKRFCNTNSNCKIIFFMGSSRFDSESLIQRESIIYNDIVQFSFKNSYFNLTLLSVMALKYCYRYFNTIKFYIKTDDDMLLNYKLLFAITEAINPNKNIVYGHLGKSMKVNRNSRNKNYIPYFEYQYDVLPNYVYGALIIITKSALKLIYNQTLYNQHYVWREDINLGILCKLCDINIKQFPNNIDIKLRSNKCNIINTVIAREISSLTDCFYCMKRN